MRSERFRLGRRQETVLSQLLLVTSRRTLFPTELRSVLPLTLPILTLSPLSLSAASLLTLFAMSVVVLPSPAESQVQGATGANKNPIQRNVGPGSSKGLSPTGPTAASLINTPIKDKWALVIGISNFAHPEYNLKFAAKDARDFKEFLINECNFARDHIRFLENEKATRGAIMDAFGDSWLPRVVMPGDLVVIFISTHGTPSSRDAGGKNYIVAYDTNRDRLYSEGVEMNGLATQIKERVKTDRVLILMDTCYSGAAVAGARGAEQGANFDPQVIAQGTGRLVLSSSSPDERSWEGAGYQNGIFTKNLIDALRKNNKQVDVLTAFDDVKKNVQWEAQSNFGASQTPVLGGNWEGVKLVLSTPPAAPRTLPPSLKDVPKSFDDFDLGNLSVVGLLSMGIARIDCSTGGPIIAEAGTNMIVPEQHKRLFMIGGCKTSSVCTLSFEQPVSSFSLTRVGVINGSSLPKWRMDAYDAAGNLVATTGEANFGFDAVPRKFTVRGNAPIAQVKINYDNRNVNDTPWSTYNSLPIAGFEHD